MTYLFCCATGWLALAAAPALAQTPFITGIVPLANAPAAAPGGPLIVSFSQPLPAAAGAALRVFSGQRGGLRTLSAPATVSGNTLRFVPGAAPFVAGETVQYTVTTGAGQTAARVGQFTVAVGGAGRADFAPHAAVPPVTVGAYPQGIALADVDGDGDLDLLTANALSIPLLGTVSVRLNNGTGVFTAPARNPEPTTGRQPRGLAVGDLDGDGDLDFAAVCNSNLNTINQVSIRLNDGTGSFAPPVATPEVGNGDAPGALLLGDVDGDGDLDMLTSTSQFFSGGVNSAIHLWLNDGAAAFRPPASGGSIPLGGTTVILTLSDLDNDGDLDLLVVKPAASLTTTSRLAVFRNDGHGHFAAPPASAELTLPETPVSLTLGDVDGDNDPDVVLNNGAAATATVWLNDGTGQFVAPALAPSVTLAGWTGQLLLGDFDADGDLDLAGFSWTSNTLSIRLNDGAGHFAAPATNADIVVGPASEQIYYCSAADVDGDGDLDLLLPSQSQAMVRVLLNGPRQLTAAIVSVQTPAFTLAPNPAHVTATATGLPAYAPVQVLDALGREVLRATADAGGTARLPLPVGLMPGLYVVRSGEQVRRLVVE